MAIDNVAKVKIELDVSNVLSQITKIQEKLNTLSIKDLQKTISTQGFADIEKNANQATNAIERTTKSVNNVTKELATISQTVSNGIASTSIVTTTDDGAAIFYEQVDESGSKIYMNANTIGIHSNYFSLDNSGLEMTGNLFAKDKNGIITAGVIGDNTSENDIRFFAGPKDILSPITKQKLICVKDIINEKYISASSTQKKNKGGKHKIKYN